jgi:hypothetical protein
MRVDQGPNWNVKKLEMGTTHCIGSRIRNSTHFTFFTVQNEKEFCGCHTQFHSQACIIGSTVGSGIEMAMCVFTALMK